MDVRPVEVKPWPGNKSLDVQSLHDALLDYDHDYNPDYFKSTDLKKRLCNLLGDLNHCQVKYYNFDPIVCEYKDNELYPNCGIRTPVKDNMDLRKGVLVFLNQPIQDPTIFVFSH